MDPDLLVPPWATPETRSGALLLSADENCVCQVRGGPEPSGRLLPLFVAMKYPISLVAFTVLYNTAHFLSSCLPPEGPFFVRSGGSENVQRGSPKQRSVDTTSICSLFSPVEISKHQMKPLYCSLFLFLVHTRGGSHIPEYFC